MMASIRLVIRPVVVALGLALASGCAARRPAPPPVPAPPAAPAPAPDPPTDSPPPPSTPPVPIPSAEAARSAAVGHGQDGYATYVARSFHGRTAANGERFDERKLVAAHRTLPFGSLVRVTNVSNGRSVVVRIVDRGPYGVNYREGTIIDLSRAAANRLQMIRDGQVPARVEVLELAAAK
jgi:peptidoglycan lytic transglycosylase